MPKGIYKRIKPVWNKGLNKYIDKRLIRSESSREKIKKIAKESGYGRWMIGRYGKKSPNWKGGKPRCIDCNKRLRHYGNSRCLICKGIKYMGSGNPSWKGGVVPEQTKIRHGIEIRLWRESVFARDNWTCQKCFIKGGDLQAHHILNFSQYPKLRFAIDNGITLCRNCHNKFHNKYKRINNNKNQLDEFKNQ